MTDPVVEALMERLDRMERGLRRWRVMGGIAWAALAASVALSVVLALRVPVETERAEEATPEPEDVAEDEVRARAFVLVDEEGRPRAALAMRPDGTPALAFTAEDGRIIWKAP
jgi:hypothetical protein